MYISDLFYLLPQFSSLGTQDPASISLFVCMLFYVIVCGSVLM